MKNTNFMEQAFNMAKAAATQEEVPVGVVLVENGKVIAAAHNLMKTNNDPTAHAEMLVVRQACEKLGAPRLPDCDLYVTLEPCPMCATAISFARIRRVYFGAYDPKGGGVDHGPKIFQQPTCHHAPEVYGGILEADCGQILKDFFNGRR